MVKDKRTPLERAVDIAGGQSALARQLSTPERRIYQQHVWNWLFRDGKVPPEHARAIENITGISVHELRPDVFGGGVNLPART